MKYTKHILVAFSILLFSFLFSYLVRSYNNGINSFGLILAICLFSFFIFNLIVRKIAWFKPYFTSKYNFFSTKYRTKIEFDIPKDLMFKKVIEVIENSKFKIQLVNEDMFEVFAISPMSFKSWGENIYIDFQEDDGKTIMNFCSATISQIYSWGKNEQNYDQLVQNIEESLII
jgi:hypothetical protein